MPDPQIIINLTDSIPPANVATIDKNGLTGTVDTKTQVNNKIKAVKEELSEMVQTNFKGIILPTDPEPNEDGSYRPGLSSNDENVGFLLDYGTVYPNAGNLRAKKGYSTLFFKKGTVWTKSEEELPQATKNIPDFADISFPAEAGMQVIYDDRLWQVKDGKIALSTDIPGDDTNNVWKSIVRQTINNITNNFDPDQIIPSEALYEDGSIAVDIEKRISFDGVDLNRRETTKWYDGTPMTDARVDNDIFIKKDGKYLQKTISKETLLKIGTIYELRQTNAYYEGQEIILLGYYESGDKDPVHYKYTTQHYTSAIDNGGLTIKTDRGVWVAQFNGKCSVKDFGAIKDTDCTAIINKALQYVDDVTIPEAYIVDPTGYIPTTTTTTFKYTGGIKPRNNNTLRWTKDGLLYILPNSEPSYCILNLERVKNVKIIDFYIKGDVEDHLGTTGEGGYGLSIKGCEDIYFNGCATHLWGDGFNLGPSKIAVGDVHPNRNIRCGIVETDYCRRNGWSIMSCDGFYGERISARFNGTIRGINPRYGGDIEPNNGGDDVINVVINEVYTEGNSEGGLEIVPAYMQDLRYVNPGIFKVKINNYYSYKDGVSSEFRGTLRIAFADLNPAVNPNVVENKPIDGFVEITNTTIVDSTGRALTFWRVPDNGMYFNFTNVKIINPCTSTLDLRETKNAVTFIPHTLQQTYGMINIEGLYIYEPKTDINKMMYAGVYFKSINETDKLYKNVSINNFDYAGLWKDQTEVATYGATEKSVSIKTARTVPVVIDGTDSMNNYTVIDELPIDITIANPILTLNSTIINKNRRLKITARIPAGTFAYVKGRTTSQVININPRNSEQLVLTSGSSVTLEIASDGQTWDIVDSSGAIYNDQFRVKGTTGQRPTGLTSTDAGFRYYDTSIANYVTWNGTSWILPFDSTWTNITTSTANFTPSKRVDLVTITPPDPTAPDVGFSDITLKLSSAKAGDVIIMENNKNFNVTLRVETGVQVNGNPAYVNVIMRKARESVILLCSAANNWRLINVNSIAAYVPAITLPDAAATYGTAERALLTEVKNKLNLILSTAVTAGQRASS